ncbi:MAG TPA: glycosyltransferase family 4 protein [Pilimelia sp.]|nr:glycosyltransferase family 4 protein [Pilimelia sp.]
MEKEAGQSDDRPLKIAMVVPPWCEIPPPGYGGLEQVCAVLVDGLVARGHDVTLFGAGERTGTKARFVSTGPTQFGRMNEALPELAHVVRVNELIDRGGFDVVHDHTNAGPLTAPQRRAPTVVTVHGCPRGELSTYLSRLDRRVGLVAISYAQRRIAGHLPWSAVVHHGIEPAETPRLTTGDGPALWLARFCPDKAPELAIQACREAGVPLVLAGKCQEAMEYRHLEEVVKPMLGPDVELIVNGCRDTTSRLLAEARCMLLPIRWDEPFGMVMIEAMAMGTPVVALNRGAVPEVVKHGVTGFVCDRPEDLADAVRRVGTIDRAACVAHTLDRFSPDLMARGYEQVYRWMGHRAPVVHHALNTGRSGLAAAVRGTESFTGHGWPAH